MNGQRSSWTNVTSGVPQGLVLGPILFLIYVSDVPGWIKTEMGMLADDMNRVTEDCVHFKKTLNRLQRWSENVFSSTIQKSVKSCIWVMAVNSHM